MTEVREGSIIWNYRSVQEEQGFMVAKELNHHLKRLLHLNPVDIVMGQGYIEIKPSKLKK